MAGRASRRRGAAQRGPDRHAAARPGGAAVRAAVAGGPVGRAQDRCRQAAPGGLAALAIAIPYALLAGLVAVASRSALASASVPQAVACGFVLALTAGCLGGARALTPWRKLAGLLPDRARSLLLGLTGALAVLTAAGAILAAAALALHMHEFDTLQNDLAPGAIGAALLLLLQVGYAPNAVIWAISFALGPGFAVGSGTVVAPTGAALGQLPAFPMLAALPPGLHSALPSWLSVAVLALPYLAGVLAGSDRRQDSADTSAGSGAIVGTGLRRAHRGDARRARRVLRRPAWRRPACGGRPFAVAGDPGGGAGDRRRSRHRGGSQQLAQDGRHGALCLCHARGCHGTRGAVGDGQVPGQRTGRLDGHAAGPGDAELAGHRIYLDRWADDGSTSQAKFPGDPGTAAARKRRQRTQPFG